MFALTSWTSPLLACIPLTERKLLKYTCFHLFFLNSLKNELMMWNSSQAYPCKIQVFHTLSRFNGLLYYLVRIWPRLLCLLAFVYSYLLIFDVSVPYTRVTTQCKTVISLRTSKQTKLMKIYMCKGRTFNN